MLVVCSGAGRVSDDGAIKVEQITPGPLETTGDHWGPLPTGHHGHGHWRVESEAPHSGDMYAGSARGC